MSNDKLQKTYEIMRLNDKIYIENKKQNKMISIGKDTYVIHQENINFKKLKVMEETIHTQGILGIIELMSSYYLLYITKSNTIGSISNNEIHQITQVAFIPLTTIPIDQLNNHKLAQSCFLQMISRGMYYYSPTYDLTLIIQNQRGYIDYKLSDKDYLWNINFMTYFLKSGIPIESYFVFCIHGYISSFSSILKGNNIVYTFIARKTKCNYRANHTQLESIIIYNDKTIFNYVMYSFGYDNDLKQGEKNCIDNFQKYYSHYNQTKNKTTYMIINILDNDTSSDTKINQIIASAFNKLKLIHFRCVKEFSKEIGLFITGITSFIHDFEYNIINKQFQYDMIKEENLALIQESRIQKGFFVIISKDGTVTFNEFARYLFWEVIKYFFKQFKFEELKDKDKLKNKNSNRNTIDDLNNEIKKCLFGVNEWTLVDAMKANFNNANRYNNGLKPKSFHYKKPLVKLTFKEKYEEMFDEYLKQLVGIDRFNDYTAMNYFLFDQQIKPIVKQFNHGIISKEEKEEKLTVYISTWNVGALSVTGNQDISPLLHPLNYCGYLNKNPADIYLIGLQEIVNLNPQKILFTSNETVVNYWIKKISKEIPNYELVTSMSLVGVLFLFFTKKKIKSELEDIQTQITKTGFFGTLGNKGSCSVRFTYHKKQFAFASGHLAAGVEANEHRLTELNNIASTLYNKDRRFCNSDYWFIFGDMNFRIDLDAQTVLLYIEALYLGFLKANDQLNQNKKKLKFEYEEEDIYFYPSYKFFPKTNAYNTKQTPSWCDRIIYKPTKYIKALAYNKIELLCSDHIPVMGIFQLIIPE